MPLAGIAQSLGLFFVVCLAMATLLSLAIVALARMERATVPVQTPVRRLDRPDSPARAADAVSSPGGCTYGPPGSGGW